MGQLLKLLKIRPILGQIKIGNILVYIQMESPLLERQRCRIIRHSICELPIEVEEAGIRRISLTVYYGPCLFCVVFFVFITAFFMGSNSINFLLGDVL